MKTYSKWIVAFAILYASSVSYAFKIDTHIWIGQQVVNDLEDDGRLSFDVGGETVSIDIRDDIVDAILSNKSAYLMGNIGPDAAPDVVAGQAVIHPGVRDADTKEVIGWQTYEWLEHLLRAAETSELGKAYTYGVIGHSASDTFAHTYVNQYAGDVFDIFDETLVEERHFILESYISNYMPPIRNYRGQNLGEAWQLVEMNDELAEFIRDTLIFDDQVQAEYWKVSSATHLAALYEYRKHASHLATNLSEKWAELDAVILQIVAYFFEVELGNEEAEAIVGLHDDIVEALGDGSENVQQFSNDMYEHALKFEQNFFDELSASRARMQNAEQAWLSKLQEWRRKLLDVEDLPSCGKKWYCTISFPPDCGWHEDPICKATRDALISANRAILNAAENLENEALGLRDNFEDSVSDLRDANLKAVESVHAIQNSIKDAAQIILVKDQFNSWVNDIDVATTEYVKAANQSIVNTINPDESALDPMYEWFECYHLSLIGVVSSTLSDCQLIDGVFGFLQSLEDTLLVFDEAARFGDIPNLTDLRNLRDYWVDELVENLKEEASERITDMLPEEIQQILVILDVEVDDTVLNQTFSKREVTDQPKGLVMIGDMSDRVKLEMGVSGSDSVFEPSEYAVVYNSVVLAKLSLLDDQGFEDLALFAQSEDYFDYLFSVDNIVASALGSIDGNHQWMPLPPPKPNSSGVYSTVVDTYSSDRSAIGDSSGNGAGFILWKEDMRDKMFRKLFKGPLSPGIDAPEVIGESSIVSSSYPYKPCEGHPFPDDIEDNTCVSISITPVISLLF